MLLEQGEVADYEIRLKTSGGERRADSVNCHILRSPDGAIIGSEGVIRDISERKAVEEALRESEARYRSIFENIQDVYYRTDAEGIIIEISPSIERSGFTREAADRQASAGSL